MIQQTSNSTLSWQQTIKETLKGFLFVAIFAIFPILVLQFAKMRIEDLEIDQQIKLSRLKHERILTKIKQADDTAQMAARSVKKIFEMLRLFPEMTLKKSLISSLRASYPEALDLFIFDGNGKLIPDLSSNRHPRRAIEFAFEALNSFAKGKSAPAGKTGILKNMIGLQEIPNGLKTMEKAFKLGNRNNDSHFSWFTEPVVASTSSKFPHSYMAFLHQRSLASNYAIKHSIKWVNSRYNSLQAGYFDLRNKSDSFFPAKMAAYNNLRLNIIRSEGKYENFFRENDYFASYYKRSANEYVFIIQPIPVFFKHGSNLTLNLLCLLWMILVFRNLPTQTRQFQGGITAKLVFLFLFAIGTPSFLLMTGGYYALKDHSNVLLQDLEKKIVSKLNHFDEKYPIELQNIGDFLNGIIFKAQQHRNLEDIIGELKACRAKKDLFMQGYLLNEKGTELFSVHENQTDFPAKNKKIVILVARELLSRLNRSLKVDSGTLMMEATEDFFSSMLDANFDFNVLIKSMGEFIPMTFGAEGSYLFSEAILNDDGYAEYAVIFASNRGKLARKFIARNINSLIGQQEISWQVNAFGLSNLAPHVITTPAHLKKLKDITKTLQAKNAPVREIVASGSEEILWYAQRGAHIQDYAMVVSTSLEPLKQEISLKWFYLIFLAATLFVIAALIGFTLSTQFLKPIEGLTEGVKAIDKRQFDLKIPVYSGDELGQLSNLLNSVIEGMKDLQVASIVQTSLFPSERLCEKGIEIYGHSRAMTDIGGDYFDYFVADQSRIIGLVGDVSGHGVSAALIMGMAKFAFTTAEAANRPLTETLTSFNLFLVSNIKRKKMMTMFLYCVNTDTYELEFSCAGHNPPMLLHQNAENAKMIETESFPLGIREKSKYQQQSIVLEPGDKMLMYTDGIIEATDNSGNMIGYEQALKWFAGCVELDAQQAVEEMFARFDHATQNKPAEDDISLIVLRRLPS